MGSTSGRVTRLAGAFLVAVGATVLAGWVLDVHALKGLAGAITMKANAAIGLLACGLALRWLQGGGGPWRITAVRVCAAIASGLGAVTFTEHVTGWDAGIDQLLFEEPPGALATRSPGRMGPNASLCLSLAGVALVCLTSARPRAVTAGQVLAAVIGTLALIPMVGYLYGAEALFAIARYTGIALHTSVGLLVLCAGMLSARAHEGPVAAVTSHGAHGVMARRLLVPAIGLPLLLGQLYIGGVRLGWFDAALGAAMFVVAAIVLLSATIWRTAVALGQSERARDELLVRERAARERAERADRLKDEFLAALSHELRTPLNAILGWLQMLQQRRVPDDMKDRATDAVWRNAAALTHLIEDLLDTSRIGTGRMTLAPAPVDMNEVVRSAVESVLPLAEARRVRVLMTAAPELPRVSGDARRLQQVVWNLLSNGIKFSPPGADVHADVSSEGGTLVVRVRDSGEGIPPEFLDHVFDRFRQADASVTRTQSGLGLGLYIARQIAELHGGMIDAASDGPGHGSIFTLRLPAAERERRAELNA